MASRSSRSCASAAVEATLLQAMRVADREKRLVLARAAAARRSTNGTSTGVAARRRAQGWITISRMVDSPGKRRSSQRGPPASMRVGSGMHAHHRAVALAVEPVVAEAPGDRRAPSGGRICPRRCAPRAAHLEDVGEVGAEAQLEPQLDRRGADDWSARAARPARRRGSACAAGAGSSAGRRGSRRTRDRSASDRPATTPRPTVSDESTTGGPPETNSSRCDRWRVSSWNRPRSRAPAGAMSPRWLVTQNALPRASTSGSVSPDAGSSSEPPVGRTTSGDSLGSSDIAHPGLQRPRTEAM